MKMWCCAWMWVVLWYKALAHDAVPPGVCNVTIGDHYYREETLVSGHWFIRDLAVDHNTQIVYFNYPQWGRWFNAKVDMISKTETVLEELRGVCRFTVDQVRGYVYAGCDNHDDAPSGLYQWDSNTGRFELAGNKGQNIKFVHYYNNTLYYSLHSDDLLRAFNNDHSSLVSTLPSEVRLFVFDSHGDLIFNNWTGVYRKREDSERETRYEEYKFWVYGLAADNHGSAYVCDTNEARGIWRLHDRIPLATKILDVLCTGITFDADNNIIYGELDSESIIRLVKC